MAVFQSRENANLAKLMVLPEMQPAVSTSSTEVPTGKADTRNLVRSHSLHEEPVEFHGIFYRDSGSSDNQNDQGSASSGWDKVFD